MTRPGWSRYDLDALADSARDLAQTEAANREDARRDWPGDRWDDDGRDEPRPEPAPAVDDWLMEHFRETGARMRAGRRRREW